MSKRVKRKWHKDFIDYMKFIIGHKNYASMPNKFKPNGKINWVSPSDKKRARWWDKKKKQMHCNDRAEVARKIFPTELKGLRPCQICGRKMNIHYVYPNKNTLRRLNSLAIGNKFEHREEDIYQIYNILESRFGKEALKRFIQVFDIPSEVKKTKENLLEFIVSERITRLSPGVMSNAPDRLDGFHTYNACHRSREDTGRHRSNLARYTQDRRAYENWAEGNWNLSNRLMGEFSRFPHRQKCQACGKKRKLTADHIGPISLGFTHRPQFNALCRACNSRKNNRMFFNDVKALLGSERSGNKVISWHSKFIWDLLKNKVKNQQDALKLSKLMRKNLHNVLTILALVSKSGHKEFLRKFLHPEHSYYDYRFINFEPTRGPEEIIKKPLDSKNKRKNARRYIKISFESLNDYRGVEKRKTKVLKNKKIDEMLDILLGYLKKRNYQKGERQLKIVFKNIALEFAKDF